MFNNLPKKSTDVLKALSYLHYLNVHHLVFLGIGAKPHNINAHALNHIRPPRPRQGKEESLEAFHKRIKQIKKQTYHCGIVNYGNEDLKGYHKLPAFYYLTEHGRKFLYWKFEQDTADHEIWIPAPNKTRTNDYFHLERYVWAHLLLRRWAQFKDWEIEQDLHYYQGLKTGERGRPTSLTTVISDPKTQKTLSPDGLFSINMDGTNRLFALELTRHTQTKDAVRQLYEYARSLPSIRAKFQGTDYASDPYILSVHHNPTVFDKTRKRILETPAFQSVLQGILFAKLEDLKTDFGSAWVYADGRSANLLE